MSEELTEAERAFVNATSAGQTFAATSGIVPIRGFVVAQQLTSGARNAVVSAVGIRVVGVISLRGQVCGTLGLKQCQLPDGLAIERADMVDLLLEGCDVGSDWRSRAIAGSGFKSPGNLKVVDCDIVGWVDLAAVRIEGAIELSGSHVQADIAGEALVLDHSTSGLVRATRSRSGRLFRAVGEVSLRHGHVRADVNLRGAELSVSSMDRAAVNLENLTAAGSVLLESANVHGFVSAMFAKVGQLNMSKIRVAPPIGRTMQRTAVRAQNLDAHGTVFLSGVEGNPSYFEGEVDFNRAVIADSLEISEAWIHSVVQRTEAGLTALNLIGARIRHTLMLSASRIDGAIVLERLECEELHTRHLMVNGHLGHDEPTMDQAQFAVVLSAAKIDRFEWMPYFIRGLVEMTGCTVGTYSDHPSGWGVRAYDGGPGSVHINRFPYRLRGMSVGRVAHMGASVTAEQRISWLTSQRRLDPEDQSLAKELARDLNHRGRRTEATRLLIAAEAAVRPRSPWRLVGFGYRVWPAPLAALLIIFVVISSVGAWAQSESVMAPTLAGGDTSITATACTSEYPCFEPSIYALDVLLPNAVGQLQQDDYWAPDSSARLGRATQFAVRIASILGWLAMTFLALSFTNIARKSP